MCTSFPDNRPALSLPAPADISVDEQSPEGEDQQHVQHGDSRQPEQYATESCGGKHRLPAGDYFPDGALTWRPLRKTSTARHFDQSHEHTRPRPDHGHADNLDDGPTPIHHARILSWRTAPCQFDHAHDHFAQAREEQYQCGHGGNGQHDQRIAETMSEP